MFRARLVRRFRFCMIVLDEDENENENENVFLLALAIITSYAWASFLISYIHRRVSAHPGRTTYTEATVLKVHYTMNGIPLV